LSRNHSLPVPKHHILLPAPNWSNGETLRTLPLPHVVYPAPSQPPPQYFSFAENFRHHQQQQPLTMQHQKQDSNSSSRSMSSRPLLRKGPDPESHSHLMSPEGSGTTEDSGLVNCCTDSRSSASASGSSDEHVYSSLDSPLQSPNSNNMHVSYYHGHGHGNGTTGRRDAFPRQSESESGTNVGNRTMYFV
jgi:hypothetical protein